MPALSTQTSITVRESDGAYTMYGAMGPINYEDASGKWVPISNELVSSPGATYAVENDANAFTTKLPEDASSTPVRLQADGGWVTMQMNGLSDEAPEVNGPVATFEADGALGAVDTVEYQATETGLKESINLSAPPESADDLEYVYDIDASAGLTPTLTAGGAIEFREGSSPDAFVTIPPGVMLDSATLQPATSDALSYALEQRGAGWVLTMTVSSAWLTDPARVYPVVIDPTLDYEDQDPTRDCWISQASPTASACGEGALYLRVGRASASARARALLDFDVSSVPATATINGAAVHMYLEASETQGTGAGDYGVQRAGRTWTNAATWNNSGSGAWAVEGGNPSGAVMDGHTLGGTISGFKGFDVTSAVNGWVKGTIAKTGLVVRQYPEDTNSVLFFRSDSASNTQNNPDGQNEPAGSPLRKRRPFISVVYTNERTPPANLPPGAPFSVSASPGGAGYTTVLAPSVSGASIDDSGPVSLLFRISKAGVVVWQKTITGQSGQVVSTAVGLGYLSSGQAYQLSVQATDSQGLQSSITSYSFQTDSQIARLPANECDQHCSELTPSPAVLGTGGSILAANEVRVLDLSAYTTSAEVDSVLFDLTAETLTGGTSGGTVTIYNPDYARPILSTLAYGPGGATNISGEVPLSGASTVALRNTSTGTVRLTLTLRKVRLWGDAEDEAQIADAEDPDLAPDLDEVGTVPADAAQDGTAGELTAEQVSSALNPDGSRAAVDIPFGTPTCQTTHIADGETMEMCETELTMLDYTGLVQEQSLENPISAAQQVDATEAVATASRKASGCGASRKGWKMTGRYSACTFRPFRWSLTLRRNGVPVDHGGQVGTKQIRVQLGQLTTTVGVSITYTLDRTTGMMSSLPAVYQPYIDCEIDWPGGPGCGGYHIMSPNAFGLSPTSRAGSAAGEISLTGSSSTMSDGTVYTRNIAQLGVVTVCRAGAKCATGNLISTVFPTIRCDHAYGLLNTGTGCVFPDYVNTLYMSQSPTARAPQTAAHIAAAQSRSHLGQRGSQQLHRLVGAAIKPNRAAAVALCNKARRDTGLTGSCDEYPFASTIEGCANYYFASSCSVRLIPLGDNRLGGNLLASFYRKYRVNQGDGFYVEIDQ